MNVNNVRFYFKTIISNIVKRFLFDLQSTFNFR